ncbi:MAG: zf-HC2 domain-containing protein [Candidatus Solibacter sp.]
MNCERIREQIPEALAGRLSKADRETLVEHLESCGACRTEVAELNAVWRGLEAVKSGMDAAPDSGAKTRFQDMLAAYQAGMQAAQPVVRKNNVAGIPARPVWQAAIAAGLVLCGILFGRYLPQTSGGSPELAQLRSQVENLNQMVALSMLQGQSPSARMRGVTYSERIAQPDPQVLDALLQAVNHDSSVNVRLSAVDALQKFGGDPETSRAMVRSIPEQDSPLVQIALVDMLVQLNARVAAPDLARLANDSELNEMVRQRMLWAVNKLETK